LLQPTRYNIFVSSILFMVGRKIFKEIIIFSIFLARVDELGTIIVIHICYNVIYCKVNITKKFILGGLEWKIL